MDHWRAVLPAGAFCEVQYKDLIEDPAIEVLKLLDYCRPEWHDACMNFHETKRSLKTASITQVRCLMYEASLQKWRRYEKHLGPLFDTLGELLRR